MTLRQSLREFRKWALAAAAILAFALPAAADNITVCAPDVAGGSQGPRTVGGVGSPVPSGSIYTLNGQGCTRVPLQDYGYFQSQGFTQQSSEFTAILNTGVQAGAANTTNFVIPMPAKTYLKAIVMSNSVAVTVTGGVSVGTTANGTDVVAARTLVGAVDQIATLALTLPVTTGLAYTLNVAAVTGWNGGNVTVTVIAGYY